MSVISGSISAVDTAKSSADATSANMYNTEQTNATNLTLNEENNAANKQLQDEARGSTGHSVLPDYMGTAEVNAANDATSVYNSLKNSSLTQSQVAAILSKYNSDYAAEDKTANDIATGEWTNQALAEEQPVAAARTNVALTKRDSALDALSDTLNQIDAIQAKKGYVGDTFGNKNLAYSARRSAYGTAAGDISGAALTNAQDVQQIQSAGRNTQLQNINLGNQQATSALKRATTPNTTVAQQYSEALTPYSFFNTGYHAYTPYTAGSVQNMPTQTGNTSSLGAASGALSSVGSTALSSYLKSSGSNSAATGAATGASISGGGSAADWGSAATDATEGGTIADWSA